MVLVPPHPLEALLLEDAQNLGLGLEAHVRDLVQEQGAPVGQVELAPLAAAGSGEGALLVAEELALDELLGDGRAVHVHQGVGRAGALAVDGVGHQLLAGAVLAGDEHPGPGGGHTLDGLAHGLDGRAVAGEARGLALLAQEPVLLG